MKYEERRENVQGCYLCRVYRDIRGFITRLFRSSDKVMGNFPYFWLPRDVTYFLWWMALVPMEKQGKGVRKNGERRVRVVKRDK